MTDAAIAEKPRRGRKPRDITQTPEFQAAVSKVAAEAVAAALGNIKTQFQAMAPAAAAEPGNNSWMQELAVTLAEIGNQGTGRKTVPPAVMKQRADARARMIDLILKAKAEKRPATYQLRAKVLLGNRVIEPFWTASDHTTKSTEIDWAGIPNDAMVPMNTTAKEIFAAFTESIGTMEKVVPEEKLGITAGGLVVRNGAVTVTTEKRTGEAPQVTEGSFVEDEGLTVHHGNQPGRYKDVHVLGTIQQPARQTI
jgi:hypothetical protein